MYFTKLLYKHTWLLYGEHIAKTEIQEVLLLVRPCRVLRKMSR